MLFINQMKTIELLKYLFALKVSSKLLSNINKPRSLQVTDMASS